MGVKLQSSAAKKQPEPDINVTPLVDVVLVLLIIFMVVTPAIAEGEQIELPKIAEVEQKPKDLNPIEVTIALNGKVIVDEEPVDPARLKQVLIEKHAEDSDRSLLLKTDTRMDYGKVRDTFAELQDIGFSGVSLKVVEKQAPAAAGG